MTRIPLEPGKPIFVPRWGEYLGRLEQRNWLEIMSNPVSLAHATIRAARLFNLGFSCIQIPAEWLIEANRSPTFLRTFQAAVEILATPASGRNVLIGSLPGPNALYSKLVINSAGLDMDWWDDCCTAVQSLLRFYGDHELFSAVLLEDECPASQETATGWLVSLRTIFTTASYYGLPLMFVPGMSLVTDEILDHVMSLRPTGLLLREPVDFPPDLPAQTVRGRLIPDEILVASTALTHEWVERQRSDKVSLFSTSTSLPPTLDPALLRDLATHIQTH